MKTAQSNKLNIFLLENILQSFRLPLDQLYSNVCVLCIRLLCLNKLLSIAINIFGRDFLALGLVYILYIAVSVCLCEFVRKYILYLLLLIRRSSLFLKGLKAFVHIL